MHFPECREYFNRLALFVAWARERKEDLDCLIRDQFFLNDPTKSNRILFCLDAFDVIELAFPYASPLKKQSLSLIDEETQNKLLRGQLARSSLLFGLSKNLGFYPIFIPPPYHPELYSFLSSHSIISRDLDLKNQVARFIEKVAQAGFDGNRFEQDLSHADSRQKREWLQLVLSICPDLLFIVTGLFKDGMQIIRTIFENGAVTFDPEKWGSHSDAERQVGGASLLTSFDFEDKRENKWWRRNVVEKAFGHRRHFSPSYYADVKAMRFVNHLNSLHNRNNTLILFVSGADMVNDVLRDERNREYISCSFKDPPNEYPRMFFRGLDVFRFYSRFRERLKRQKIAPTRERIIQEAQEDLSYLEVYIENANIESKVIDCMKGNCLSDPELRGRCSEKRNLELSVIDDVGRIKEKLFSAHLMESLDVFQRPYLKEGGFNPLLTKEFYSNTALAEYAPLAIRALTSWEKMQDEFAEAILEQRVCLTNEFLSWTGFADIQNPFIAQEVLESYFVDFTLFPFRAKFLNPYLLERIRKLQELFIEPKARPSPKELKRFHDLLASLANSCAEATRSADNFWGKKIDVTDFCQIESRERRLVILVILFALGHYRLVYQDAERLLLFKDPQLKDEFRVVQIQARIRELMSGPLDEERKKEGVREIIEVCKEWLNRDKYLDYRIWHLMAFGAGSLARVNDKGEPRWLPEFGRSEAIDACARALECLREKLRQTLDAGEELGWDDRHLLGTVASNMAYYLAIDDENIEDSVKRANVNKEDIRRALNLIRKFGLDESYLTSVCLHNKGFVYMKKMQRSDALDDIHSAYREAAGCFRHADEKRRKHLNIGYILEQEKDQTELLDMILHDKLGERRINMSLHVDVLDTIRSAVKTRLGKDTVRLQLSYWHKMAQQEN